MKIDLNKKIVVWFGSSCDDLGFDLEPIFLSLEECMLGGQNYYI